MEYGLVAVWLGTYLVLGLAALPVAAVVLRRLPDRGAGVALPLALVVVTLPAYWVGQVAFGWPALLAGLAVLVGATVAAGRWADPDPDWEIAAETAAVFAVAFGFLVAVRAVDPAVHPIGGEKFLDFGLLKSLLREATFGGALPPEDFWFAGEPVQYYYGGHLIASLLAVLTGTTADYAYNLALAGFYGMLVTAAFGVGGALADARGAPRRLGGLASAFFVGFASNFSTLGQVLLWLVPGGLARSVTGATGVPADRVGWTPGEFSYWTASRVITDDLPGMDYTYQPPTEFPLFAWLNGDMHAHMMSTPFLLLVVALLAAYYLTPEAERRRRAALVFACVPTVGGLLAVVNTWSFPSVAGLTLLALLFAPADPTTLLPGRVGRPLRAFAGTDPEGAAADGGLDDGPPGAQESTAAHEDLLAAVRARAGPVVRREAVRATAALGAAIAVGLVGVAVALPFLLQSASSREVALLATGLRSDLGELLVVQGGFLLVFVAFFRERLPGGVPVALPVAVLVLVAVVGNVAVLAISVPLLVVGWAVVRHARADAGFETVLVVAGAGLVTLVEFLYVVEEAGVGRFNTIFKTYAQVWVLWGAAAGAMFATLIDEHVLAPATGGRREAVSADGGGSAGGTSPAGDEGSGATDGGPPPAATGGGSAGGGRPSLPAAAAAVLLVVSLSLYGGFALSNHFTGDTGYYERYATVENPTLNATQFVERNHPGEAPAIRWLDAREGRPTIVTAAPGGYYWQPADGKGASVAASLTGLPTVAGWFHERGYRGGEVYNERVAEVERIYTGDRDAQGCLLAKHDVAYVYVGPAERANYLVDVAAAPGVGEPVRRGDVLVYPVDQQALADYDGENC